jgi:hypothetical protein
MLDKLLDESVGINVAQEIFDGFVLNFGVLDSIVDGLDILGLPE